MIAKRKKNNVCKPCGAVTGYLASPFHTVRASDDSPDRRAEAVSPRASGGVSSGRAAAVSVSCLVRGHYGSVLALGVFPGTQEYVTAGSDR